MRTKSTFQLKHRQRTLASRRSNLPECRGRQWRWQCSVTTRYSMLYFTRLGFSVGRMKDMKMHTTNAQLDPLRLFDDIVRPAPASRIPSAALLQDCDARSTFRFLSRRSGASGRCQEKSTPQSRVFQTSHEIRVRQIPNVVAVQVMCPWIAGRTYSLRGDLAVYATFCFLQSQNGTADNALQECRLDCPAS